LNYTEQILRSAGAQLTCARQTIKVDLTRFWAETLVKSGFDPQLPSGWLLEGFLFYLISSFPPKCPTCCTTGW